MEPSFLKSICPLLFGLSDNAWVMEARTQEDLVLAGDRVRVRILTPCHVYVFCPNRGAFVKALFVQRPSTTARGKTPSGTARDTARDTPRARGKTLSGTAEHGLAPRATGTSYPRACDGTRAVRTRSPCARVSAAGSSRGRYRPLQAATPACRLMPPPPWRAVHLRLSAGCSGA